MPTLKDLQEQIDKLTGKIKTRDTAWLIAAGVAFILIVLLLLTVFKGKGEIDQSYKLEIERLQDKIEGLERESALRDSIISQHDQKLLENRKTETIIKHHYDKISVDVPKLNNDQLRNEITNY